MMKPPMGSRNQFTTLYPNQPGYIGKSIKVPKGLSQNQFWRLLQAYAPNSIEYTTIMNSMSELVAGKNSSGWDPDSFNDYIMDLTKPSPNMPGPGPGPGPGPMPEPGAPMLPVQPREDLSRPIHLLGGQPRPPGVSPGPPPGYSGPWM